ncbi:MAG: NINE protein [Lachnospiraceae bacterium]|nr:NINE protein [Lachnospiraceae bacterium]
MDDFKNPNEVEESVMTEPASPEEVMEAKEPIAVEEVVQTEEAPILATQVVQPEVTASPDPFGSMVPPPASSVASEDVHATWGGEMSPQDTFAEGAQSQMNQVVSVDAEAKSKLAAGLFGIFLGYFGVHNFYLGNMTKAVIQLLLSVVGVWFFGVGMIAASIWGLVEGILILSSREGSKWHQDAKGIELKD